MKKTFSEYSIIENSSYVMAAKELESIIKILGFDCHLGFGSLLATSRDGRLIDGDYDIDICILSKHYYPKLVQQDCKELFQLLVYRDILKRYWDEHYNMIDEPMFIEKPFGQAHVHLNGFVIDVFMCWIDEYGNYNTCQWGKLGKHSGFIKKPLEGILFDVPHNYEEILTTLYNDWQTPSNEHPSKYLTRKCYFV